MEMEMGMGMVCIWAFFFSSPFPASSHGFCARMAQILWPIRR